MRWTTCWVTRHHAARRETYGRSPNCLGSDRPPSAIPCLRGWSVRPICSACGLTWPPPCRSSSTASPPGNRWPLPSRSRGFGWARLAPSPSGTHRGSRCRASGSRTSHAPSASWRPTASGTAEGRESCVSGRDDGHVVCEVRDGRYIEDRLAHRAGRDRDPAALPLALVITDRALRSFENYLARSRIGADPLGTRWV